MASSRRPRSSTTSLAPRSLRTFRALARVRGAFPLADLSAVSYGSTQSSLRLVLVGSPDATPAALRSSLRARQALLNGVLSTTAAVKLEFVPGAGSLGRRVFRSRSLSDRRALLQGGTAILQLTVPRPTAGFTGSQRTNFLAEAIRPFPGFNPVAYLLALPAAGSVRSTSAAISRVGPISSIENRPQLKVVTQLNGILVRGLQLPLTLPTRVITPLIHTVNVPALRVVPPVVTPAMHVLGVLNTFVNRIVVRNTK